MTKHAAFIHDALEWEHRNGWGPKPRTLMESKDSLTLTDGTVVTLKGGRIEIQRTPKAERQLQEAISDLHEQRPTSHVKTPEPQADDPDLLHARMYAAFRGQPFATLSELAQRHRATPAPTRKPALTLSEHRDAPPLPDGIHARLAKAVRGY